MKNTFQQSTDDQFHQMPIVFAIVGHRDIPAVDVGILETAIRSIFQQYQNRFLNSNLVLMSGLAEGADRIAARIALECQVTVTAVLPMTKNNYTKDFAEIDSQNEFNQLLEAATQKIVVQPSAVTDLTDSRQRDLCYAAVGHYFSCNANVLIALWDGHENGEIGGTADVVQEFRSGCDKGKLYEKDALLDSVDDGLVLHIWTRRENFPNIVTADHSIGSCREIHPYHD